MKSWVKLSRALKRAATGWSRGKFVSQKEQDQPISVIKTTTSAIKAYRVKLLARNAQNCVRYFNLLTVVFFAHLALVVAAMFISTVFFIPSFALTLLFISVVGLLAHQIGFHPVATLLLCAGFIIPYASLVIFLVIYFQAKAFLRNNGYVIGILGARPAPPKEAVTDEMDRLIKEGKIRIPNPSDAGPTV